MTPMPLPDTVPASRRDLLLGALLAILLIVPTILGFAVAAAGESRPPTATEDVSAASNGTAVPGGTNQADLVSRAPLANAPGTAQDALTPQGETALGIPRITFVSDDTGAIRVENGGTVSLADGYQVTVTIDPYPPSTLRLDVDLEISRNGQPLNDATIATVWDMTLMTHGPFATTLEPIGDGAFTTSFDFFMFGPWYVDATVSAPGDEPVAFRLSIYVWPV